MPQDTQIINVKQFIEATRDSGYKSTTSAVAELVDNSIQAGATHISIDIASTGDTQHPLEVVITDNGTGMKTADLRRSLQFGGSSRFGDRDGLGRYGMGLPNASLSQCRRVEVVSWVNRRNCLKCWLDVDEIISGKMRELPNPERRPIPDSCDSDSGTQVRWTRCDRLDNSRISTIERKIHSAIARMFRHYIWEGTAITVNGSEIQGVDPTYLHKKSPLTGGEKWGKTRKIKVRASESSTETGTVAITFSRLPVVEWSKLSNEEKRAMGISNGAGVSVVRAGREIEYGWHFMGTKRRENYDDWWRCQISFDPILDEAFGITHTKQQIRPRAYLQEAISPEIESTAKILNNAVRKQFHDVKSKLNRDPLEQALVQIEPKLPKIGKRRTNSIANQELESLKDRHALLRVEPPERNGKAGEYRIVEDSKGSRSLFEVHSDKGRVIIAVNKRHPFYKKEMAQYQDNATVPIDDVRKMFETMIVAAARAELTISRTADVRLMQSYRETWGHTLALLANK